MRTGLEMFRIERFNQFSAAQQDELNSQILVNKNSN